MRAGRALIIGLMAGCLVAAGAAATYFVMTISDEAEHTASPAIGSSPESAVDSSARSIDLFGFPDENTTGVPDGVKLTPYTGPCAIVEANTVIDAKKMDCDLQIQTAGVVITRSQINGSVLVDETFPSASLAISDSNIDVGSRPGTGLGAINFTASRVDITGGNRSVLCYTDCTVQESYLHGQYTDKNGVDHESGIRMGQRTTLRQNTIVCDAPAVPPDGGCSASLTGYGDFAPVRDNLIEGNLFPVTTGSYCAFGGSTRGKPYSDGAENIVFRDNVFIRGDQTPEGCGIYGPISDFDPSRPGNLWLNNRWDDGSALGP